MCGILGAVRIRDTLRSLPDDEGEIECEVFIVVELENEVRAGCRRRWLGVLLHPN